MLSKVKRMVWIFILGFVVAAAAGFNALRAKTPDIVTHLQVSPSILAAVDYRDIEEVRQLVKTRIGMEALDEVGATPLIGATFSDQYVIAEILVEHGANIWAYDRFGLTAARMMAISKTPDDSDEGQARLRLIERFKNAGYPWPPPKSDEVLRLVNDGAWPPTK